MTDICDGAMIVIASYSMNFCHPGLLMGSASTWSWTRHPVPQQQVDVVVGRQRMPTTVDRDKLPYVHALVMELFRWLPDDPIGVPRRTSEVGLLPSI